MDGQRPGKPTGIPRLSRLPQASKLPKPASSTPAAPLVQAPTPAPAAPPALRPSQSRETLRSGLGTLRNPKLRTAASRDRLSTTARADASTPPRAASSPQSRYSIAGSAPATRTPVKSLTPSGKPSGIGRPNRYSQIPATNRSYGANPAPQAWISAEVLDEQDVEEQADIGAGIIPEDASAQSLLSPDQSRPSLSERTMETLSRLPSSPSVKGRGAASFYDSGSVKMKSVSRPGSRGSRPGSSHHSDGSNGPLSRANSRPGSSSGLDDLGVNNRARAGSFKTGNLTTIDGSPLNSRLSMQGVSKLPSIGSRTLQRPDKVVIDRAPDQAGAQTVAARPLKSRPSINGLFKKPSLPSLSKAAAAPKTAPKVAPRKTPGSQRSSAASNRTDPSVATIASTALTNDSTEGTASGKSSSALRDQIAKAKAAKKAASLQAPAPGQSGIPQPLKSPLIPTDDTFDFGLQSDFMNQHSDPRSLAKVLQGRLATARTSGRLNIAAMNLREIPPDVMNMYNLESIGRGDGSWAESVDLTRFVAADNELEMIADSVFPDTDPQAFADDEDSQGNIFGGLETLDLHGNMLIALPLGLRRLELLTSLNLSQNRLANNCLEVVAQIPGLKDLKLGGNLLYGPLDPCFCQLASLEILDLHGNNIASLPSNFGNLERLRILNISENMFERIPFDIFAELPLTEVNARKNQLSGVLIPDSVEKLPRLQNLDVSANQLVHLTSPGRTCDMPALHQLVLSMNRLQDLPDMTGWASLLTLAADENSINAIPEGFTKLEKLRSADFSSNDIRVVPAEIGRMDNLSSLRLNSNPLRDRKFCSVSTEELKDTLLQRLEPPVVPHESLDVIGMAGSHPLYPGHPTQPPPAEDDDDDDGDDFATPPTSAPNSPGRARSHTLSSQTWPVKTGGVLDRSGTDSSSLHPVVCSKIAANHKIKEVQLRQNLFTNIPDSLSFFAETLTTLSMAKNQLLGEEYLTEDMELPALKELTLSDNKMTSLAPLMSHLRAPNLVKLDVSLNRISALPSVPIRDVFPKLEILLIANNHLDDLNPDAIAGLRVVDANNNDIAHLNARLGLLKLDTLQVTGNRFRVPKWNVLDRGTDATLRWLRTRVPLAEMNEWRAQGGHDSEEE